MENKNYRIFLFLISICIFYLIHIFFNYPLNAQYPVNNYNYNYYYDYYDYMRPNLSASYLYNTTYSNNYSWSMTQNFGKEVNIPTLLINDWTVHPAFGSTVFTAKTEGDKLIIYGTYFSAHTHGGVNFNRTLLFDNSLYSMPYTQSNQTIYQNLGGQLSFISPMSYYARQILQFSPVLHGPLLNY